MTISLKGISFGAIITFAISNKRRGCPDGIGFELVFWDNNTVIVLGSHPHRSTGTTKIARGLLGRLDNMDFIPTCNEPVRPFSGEGLTTME